MAFYDRADCGGAWIFDGEIAGAVAVDTAIFANNPLADAGSDNVGRGSSNGPFGTDTAFFDIALDNRLSIGEADQTHLALLFSKWSISAWVKSDGTWETTGSLIVMGKVTWELHYDAVAKQFEMDITTGTGSFSIATGLIPAASTWIHVCVTWDGENLRMYQNSEEVASSPVATTGTMIDSLQLPFALGNIWSDNVGNRFNGWLDEIAVFSATLTENEIYQIYTFGLAGGTLALTGVLLDNRSVLGPKIDSIPLGNVPAELSISDPETDSQSPLKPYLDNQNPLKAVIDAPA